MNQNNFIGIAIDELLRIFEILNTTYYDGKLPTPMITIQKTKRSGNLGWFTVDQVWENKKDQDTRYEINLCAEYLNREPHEIITTLHHEIVHYYNQINNINDCNGQIHNKKFKTLAESVGMIVEKSNKYGFGHTTCSQELKDFIYETIQPNANCFSYFRNVPPKEEKEKKEKTTFTYICPNCEESIKAKLDKNIICGECNVEFELKV